MFLNSDREAANREESCFNYCMSQAIKAQMRGDYQKSIRLLHESIRSLESLDRMKRYKEDMERFYEHEHQKTYWMNIYE